VICEKPLAGCLNEVNAMIRARDAPGCMGFVVFQNLYHPQTLQTERSLLQSAISPLTGATVIGCWPRGSRCLSRPG
jgi:predicted dehydrogenase